MSNIFRLKNQNTCDTCGGTIGPSRQEPEQSEPRDYNRRDALRAMGKYSAFAAGTTAVVLLSAEELVAEPTPGQESCFRQCIGSDDPDGDGDNNETEETNGTSPTISSIPPVVDVSMDAGLLYLSWPSNNTGWRLMSRTNLLIGEWQEIPGSSTNHLYQILMEGQPGGSTYYKLIYP